MRAKMRRLARPLIILLGGPTGAGKSTVATMLASRLGITRVIPTDAIREVKAKVGLCEVCFNLAEGPRCNICEDPRRDAEMGFVQAANQALRDALDKAEVLLLEPVMAFEIQTPSEFASGIIADLNSRKAVVAEVLAEGALRTIAGTVPLSKMFGYSTAIRSLSQGRASFSMTPAGYRQVREEELSARGLVWS